MSESTTTTVSSLSRDAIFRAALTYCLDDADAQMYALLKGAGNAEIVWHTLDESHPNKPSTTCAPAFAELERLFAQGCVRWGRKPTADAMKAFRTNVVRWHNRMQDMPDRNPLALADWFTSDGTQWIIAPGNPCWPKQLEDLAIRSDWAPPLCLWGKGDPRALTSCPKPVGIVGSRDVTEYGRYVAHTLAEQAAASGHLVVSGGAMGTDAAAHWGALNALTGHNPSTVGRTVAVFAGGLNHMGPLRNRTLFERIEQQGGALISELCPGIVPEARRFLMRNRIIAALSSTLVVAQARLRSGALNTAGWACELMREVYAAPGDINQPVNAGCNKIINEQKAILLCAATAIDDICHNAHHPVLADVTIPASPAPTVAQRSESNTKATSPHNPMQQPTSAAESHHDADASAATKKQHPVSAHAAPDLRGTSRNRNTSRNRGDHGDHGNKPIKVSDLPETQRIMVALIRECKKRHLITTPDALLRVAQSKAPDEIPDIRAVLELLGTMELNGIVERKADAMVLCDSVA
ncbi:DNA-protecting protein DprA [Bifidobacterium sp. LC6]|uniref:DNA-protecting protein DprA n=1 Tax=Bifidobacterium colobi TaxID=2809026 RepID=A0ABS5UVN1_9BIFI|nr:DNA-processing protein DprA [Bifidobacterium colobi]MBT1175143.1 DNA-protecting protein DprA [Bifidobacterium colobi]